MTDVEADMNKLPYSPSVCMCACVCECVPDASKPTQGRKREQIHEREEDR